MNENVNYEDELKTVNMYCYIAEDKKLWTSNLTFAKIRAEYYGTNDVFVENLEIKNLTN